MNTIKLLMVSLIAMGLTACGNQNNNPYLNGQINGAYGTQAGMYGTYPGGCVPITPGGMQIGFTAQGAQMNGAIILAGILPANSTRPGTYGQVSLGGQIMQGVQGAQGMIQYQPKQSGSGVLQIVVNPSAGIVSGAIQLYPNVTSQLYYMGGQNPYYTQPNVAPGAAAASQLCVQSVSLDIVHTANMNYGGYGYGGMSTGFINQALVYLTLSTGQTVGPIPFY